MFLGRSLEQDALVPVHQPVFVQCSPTNERVKQVNRKFGVCQACFFFLAFPHVQERACHKQNSRVEPAPLSHGCNRNPLPHRAPDPGSVARDRWPGPRNEPQSIDPKTPKNQHVRPIKGSKVTNAASWIKGFSDVDRNIQKYVSVLFCGTPSF